MNYNEIKIRIADSYNNDDIRQLAEICRAYGWKKAGQKINRCKNIIDAYIEILLSDPEPETVKLLAVIKEMLVNKLLEAYTKRKPAKADTEALTTVIINEPEKLDILTEEDRKELTRALKDLNSEPLIISDFIQFTGEKAEAFRQERQKAIDRIEAAHYTGKLEETTKQEIDRLVEIIEEKGTKCRQD